MTLAWHLSPTCERACVWELLHTIARGSHLFDPFRASEQKQETARTAMVFVLADTGPVNYCRKATADSWAAMQSRLTN